MSQHTFDHHIHGGKPYTVEITPENSYALIRIKLGSYLEQEEIAMPLTWERVERLHAALGKALGQRRGAELVAAREAMREPATAEGGGK